MTKIEYRDFEKNPLLYFLFLGIIGTVIVSKLLLTEKDESKAEIKTFVTEQIKIERLERRKADSLNHVFIKIFTERQVIDTLNAK
jgi:hypothetical protein